MSVTKKTYTPEFKVEAVRLAEANGFLQTSRDLGVNANLLHKWRRKLQEAEAPTKAFPGRGNAADPDLEALQRENARLREENAILKKAVGIFTSRPR